MRLNLPQYARRDRHPRHLAEVIETATSEYVAQCLDPEDLDFPAMPPFGSWMRAEDEASGHRIYGVVYHATTAPIDSVHRARALGLSIAELREQQPQIFALLKTEFRVAITGYVDGEVREVEDGVGGPGATGERAIVGRIYQHLPPRPPQIHQTVYTCTRAETIEFSDRLDFLRTLLTLAATPSDALLAAVLREIYRLRGGDREWLVRAGRHLSVLLKDDYDRLRAILAQVSL